jgi:2-methylcitrate dehydratase PrpD
VLALLALRRRASIEDFGIASLEDERLHRLAQRVHMHVDAACDREYPRRWGAEVTVRTNDGRSATVRTHAAAGDPERWPDPAAIDDKFMRLATRDGRIGHAAAAALRDRVRATHDLDDVRTLIGGAVPA